MKQIPALLLLSLSLAASCGRKDEEKVVVQTPQEFKAAFTKKPKGEPGSVQSAAPEVQAMADQAAEAMEKNDELTAMMSLRAMRSSGKITSDQAMAVEGMMIRAQQVLADKAAKGDAQAVAALQALRMNMR